MWFDLERQIRPGKTGEQKRVSRRSATPVLRGGSPASRNLLAPYLRPHGVTLSDQTSYSNTCGEGRVSMGQPRRNPEAGARRPIIFVASYIHGTRNSNRVYSGLFVQVNAGPAVSVYVCFKFQAEFANELLHRNFERNIWRYCRGILFVKPQTTVRVVVLGRHEPAIMKIRWKYR